jgi:hypothetical protein
VNFKYDFLLVGKSSFSMHLRYDKKVTILVQ